MGMLRVPRLSIAAKLCSIFALFAVVSALLGIISNINARQQAHLGEEVAITARAGENIERVNGLIYAVVMESRGVYMSSDVPTVKKYGDGLLAFNDRIARVVDDWRKIVRADDAEQFAAFSKRIEQFREFRKELVRRAIEIKPEAGREWGDNDANRSVRTALNKDLEAFAGIYAERTRRLGELAADARLTSWAVTALSAVTFVLVGLGVLVIWRAITRPLSAITRTTTEVAAGNSDLPVPHTDRRDEIGALARAIEVFQGAMRRNQELSRAALQQAEQGAARASHIETIVADFRAS